MANDSKSEKKQGKKLKFLSNLLQIPAIKWDRQFLPMSTDIR